MVQAEAGAEWRMSGSRYQAGFRDVMLKFWRIARQMDIHFVAIGMNTVNRSKVIYLCGMIRGASSLKYTM